MQNHKIDIHNFQHKEDREFQRLAESNLSASNKQFLQQYHDHLVRIENKAPRRIKELQTLRCFAERVQNDYEKISLSELQMFITRLTKDQEASKLSIWTRYDYQKIIKKFYKWLKTLNKTTLDVSWIKGRVPKRDIPRLERAEFLLEDDVKKLIEHTGNARDQALIAMLWDYGARVQEIGNLSWQDIQFEANGGIVTKLTGKTGTRQPWAIDSVPYIKRWLAITPHKEPTDPVWLANDQFKTKTFLKQAMSYSGIYNVLRRVFKKSGVTKFERLEDKNYVRTGGKKHNPHLFRHSRALWAALQGWTAQEANIFFGWANDSNMFAYYITMCEDDAKRKMMECRGLVPTSKPQTAKYQYCPACNTPNNPAEKWCSRCHALLDLKEHQKQQQQMALTIATFVKEQVMQDLGQHDLSKYGAQGYVLDQSVSGGQVLFHQQPVGSFMVNPNWLQCEKCKQHYGVNTVHACAGGAQ